MTTTTRAKPQLVVRPKDCRQVRIGWGSLARNKAHEFVVKARGRRIKGQGMIGADAGSVLDGFSALAHDGFDEYNLPQRWVESRQIPRVLNGRVPVRGARILDLGCGPGASTRIICHFAHQSWEIIGFDLIEASINAARAEAAKGNFRNRDGAEIGVRFECQNIAEPLCCAGQPIENEWADLAVSGGVVGLYMHEPGVERLSRELWRVVKRGGYIALDAGPSVPVPELQRIVSKVGFEFEALAKSFIVEPRPKLIFRKPG